MAVSQSQIELKGNLEFLFCLQLFQNEFSLYKCFFLALSLLDENEHAESSGRGKTAFKSHSQVFC